MPGARRTALHLTPDHTTGSRAAADAGQAEDALFDALIDELLDEPSTGRAKWLAARTGVPAAVRARLERLVRADAWAQRARFLENLPSLARSSDGAALAPGRQIGDYVLEREIGSGGMSVVWLARYADARLQRKVALKLPDRARGRSTFAARIARERDILASLEHPHIARLYDAGTDAAGWTYLAMEYVDGRPIDRFADEEQLGIDARIGLLLQAVEAVHFAHQALVVHRDLKPSNIFVNQRGEVRLLDFGIAKLLEATEGEATHLTQIDGVPLTPAYAAPEQFLGLPITTGTDVYGLGVVLYRLLTGCLPHRPKRTTRAALEEAVIEGEVVAPSRAAIADDDARARGSTVPRLRKALAGELDTIVLRALKRTPTERYSSAAAFAEDLRRYLRGEAIAAMPDRFGYRFSKFVRRHRLGLGVAAATATAVLAAGGIAAFQFFAAQEQRLQSVAVKQFMAEVLSDSEPTDATGPEGVTGKAMIDAGVTRAERDFAHQPVLRGELLVELGRLYWRHGEKPLATRTLKRAVQTLEPLVAAGNAPLNKGRAYLALVYNETDQARAEKLARTVIEACDAREPECTKAVAYAERELIYVHQGRGDPEEASAAARRSLSAFRTGYGNAHLETATAWELVAVTLREQGGRDAEARAALNEALAIADLHPVRRTQRRALENAAAVLALDAGDYADAIRRFEQLIKTLPASDGLSEARAQTRKDYATALNHQGLPAVALDQTQRALPETVGVQDGPYIAAWISAQQARALSLLGRHGEAAAGIARAAAFFATDRTLRIEAEIARRMQAEIQARAGRWEEARATVRTQLANLAAMKPNALQLAQAEDLLGVIERALGDPQAARQHHEKARGLFESELGASHPWTLRNRAYLALLDLARTEGESERAAARAALSSYLKTFPADSLWHRLSMPTLDGLDSGRADAPVRLLMLSH